MTLYELLKATQYEQKFLVFVTNIYDQNLFIGQGTRAELLDEAQNEETFDHLMDEIEIMEIMKDGKTLLVFLRDKNYERKAEELFNEDCARKWKAGNTKPWKCYFDIIQIY